jgi:UDP-glucose 4-epimerase
MDKVITTHPKNVNEFMPTKVFVTGGNGYIGSKLVSVLANKYNVTVFDKTAPQTKLPGVKYIIDNIGKIQNYSDELNDNSVIIHLSSSALPNVFSPLQDIENDLVPTVRLLDSITSPTKVKHLMYLSSGGSVYGNSEELLHEDAYISPISSYGVVKNSLEHYIRLYSKKKGFSYFVARPGNVFGPGIYNFKPQNVISNFLLKIKNNLPVEIWGDGESHKDYIYMQDFVNMLFLALEKQLKGIYNIGSGNTYTVNQIIETIKNTIPVSFKISHIDKKDTDVYKVLLDTAKIKQELNYYDFTSLEKGIQEIWNDLNNVQKI